MRIHLIRSEEVSSEWYFELVRYLQSFHGPIQFVSSDEVPSFEFDEEDIKPWNNEKEEVEFPDAPVVHYPELQAEAVCSQPMYQANRPIETPRITWKKIFSKLDLFRRNNDVGNEEFTSLISDLGNEHNWFSVPDMRGQRNFYVQSSGWGHYVDSDARFPVAYSVVTNALRHLMIDNMEELKDLIHMQPRGCMNDFNQNKKDVVLKLRTADLCSTCIDHIKKRDIDSMIVAQVFDILESIRTNVLFRERFDITKKPSRLLIAGPKKKIFFIDLPNCELRLTPLEKTVFLFFLKHEEGVAFTEMEAHKNELLEIYLDLNPNVEHAKALKSIEQLIDLSDNSLNEKLSKIRKKIENAVGFELSEYYVIAGNRTDKRSIGLDRNLVQLN